MMRVFNTLSGNKEILRAKKLKLFVCGPTVYDFSHIGHARTYVAFDAFVRYLVFKKIQVTYLQNITDVDDKIIKRAQELQEDPKFLARRFEKEYLRDMKALSIKSVTSYARATSHMPEIVSQVERLLKKGYAYFIEGDGVYYDISKFKEYGKLSHRTTQQAEDAVSRIDESVAKRNKGDFALWKISKEGEPAWKSPWGLGRPGWHIEDTAITEKNFGAQYDMHGGARDLLFPHHEAEIAQMEALSGKKPMVRLWMHTGFLTIRGEKMSKSLGNFITIRDFLAAHSARVLRFLILKAQLRSPLDYHDSFIAQTEQELVRIDEFVDKLKLAKSAVRSTLQARKLLSLGSKRIMQALDDDFNTPSAVAALFELISQGNTLFAQKNMGTHDATSILSFLKELDSVFGFLFLGKEKSAPIPSSIQGLVEMREQYRLQKAWDKADEVRKRIEQQGWMVDDTNQGPKLRRRLNSSS